MKVLVEQEAKKVDPKDEKNNTPLHHAAAKGHSNVVQVLLEYGADVNAKGQKNLTPLHHAAISGYINIVDVLKSHGANLCARDREGMTPFDYVMRSIYRHEAEVNAKVSSKK